MLRKFLVLSIIMVIIFASTTTAQAISYGVPDEGAHPNVGSIVVDWQGDYYQWCSGTLISENVFLTASHCTAPMDDFIAEYPEAQFYVTFDQSISASGTFYEVNLGDWHTNPAYYTARGYDDPGDVAVIVLTEAPAGITPAELPSLGLLDDLKADHLLNTTLFTAVGYGTIRDTNHQAWQTILDNLDRNRADQEFLSLTKAWLTNSMNLATNNGGTCYGDSGGPHFVHLDGVETDIVVSVTVTGDVNCKATDKTYRVDTEAARSFLSEYVSLP
jgi:secreted trypsin-like serine protease